MDNKKGDDSVIRLNEILDAEKNALLRADFDVIEQVFDEKKDLIDQLNFGNTQSKADLLPISGKLKRNQELFDQAISGIRAVSARIKEARKIASGVDAYNEHGEKTRFEGSGSKKLEKRA